MSEVAGDSSDTKQVGATDPSGSFTVTESERTSRGGIRTAVWSVGNSEASAAITYLPKVQGQDEVVTTPIGKTRDRYGMGMSVVSVVGKTVYSYSATQLTYSASLYYDTKQVSTLYGVGKPATNEMSGGPYVRKLSRTTTVAWADYLFQTDQYAVAFFGSGDFYNPLLFAAGSCFGTSSDCQIVPLAGPKRVAKAAIFLGSTGADQTAVPQESSYYMFKMSQSEKSELLDMLLSKSNGADDAYMVTGIHLLGADRHLMPTF